VPFNVGVYVLGALSSPRTLVRHDDLFSAYADGTVADERESYLSHFVFGAELQFHYAANRRSVAGFAGPCWARRIVLDIDRADPNEALLDARRLVTYVHRRYPESDGEVPVYFSGSKGFHVVVQLAHNPPPAVGFQHVARTLAEGLAACAGVRIDPSVYDIARVIRLPNSRHPRTGLFKRRIDAEALFALEMPQIREIARYAAGDGVPLVRSCPAKLAEDWDEAEREAARTTEARTARRAGDTCAPDTRAPRYFVDFFRFGVKEGERHSVLFRCAAWMTEQGAPPSLCFAVLTEPGLDVGLMPKDVERQIRCGIDHARRQRGAAGDPPPDPIADPEAFERWAIRHEGDALSPGATDFPLGANARGKGESG
jgi:hypothetical protein